MAITLKPQQVFKKNLYLLLALLGANMLCIFSKLYLGYDQLLGLIPLFDFNNEKNIPTLYSSIALLIASCLLAFVASKYKAINASYLPWLGLSFIFLFLSIDEMASIHESAGQAIKRNFTTSGVVFYAWVMPYAIALGLFLVTYARFVFQLPAKSRILFVASGVIYVCGAMGFEILGGLQFQVTGSRNIMYALLYTCEEFLEMLGIALFIYAILAHIVSEFGEQTVALAADQTR